MNYSVDNSESFMMNCRYIIQNSTDIKVSDYWYVLFSWVIRKRFSWAHLQLASLSEVVVVFTVGALAPEGVTLVVALAIVQTWIGGTPVLQRLSIDADAGSGRYESCILCRLWAIMVTHPGIRAKAPALVWLIHGSSAVITSGGSEARWRSADRLFSSATVVAWNRAA